MVAENMRKHDKVDTLSYNCAFVWRPAKRKHDMAEISHHIFLLMCSFCLRNKKVQKKTPKRKQIKKHKFPSSLFYKNIFLVTHRDIQYITSHVDLIQTK